MDSAHDRSHFLSLLASVLSSTHYHSHEYQELVLPTIQGESLSALANPSTLALDLAHTLAFRRGLGNSLFASPHSPVTANDVKAFAHQAYAKSNIAVLGGGISTEALSKAVQSTFGSGSASGVSGLSGGSTTYYGGEQRVPLDLHAGPSAQPTMVIAFGAAGAPTPEQKVIPHLLGGATSVKWCSGTSLLSLIADKVPGGSIETTLYPYSDASLFTVKISAPTSEGVRTMAKEVAVAIKGASGAKADEVKKAVAKAKMAEALKFETHAGLLSVAGPAVGCVSGSADD